MGGYGAGVAGYLGEVGDWDLDDDEVGGVEVVNREEVARRREDFEGLVCEIVDFDDFGGEVGHEVEEELPEGKFVIEEGQLQREDFDLLAGLVLDDQRLEDLRSNRNRKHRVTNIIKSIKFLRNDALPKKPGYGRCCWSFGVKR